MNIWTPERQALALGSLNKWHGTRHRDKLAIPGVGIDCINLITQVLFDAGIMEQRAFTGYRIDHGLHTVSTRLENAIEKALQVERLDNFQNSDNWAFGDIWIFRTGRRSGHCGFHEGGRIWHSLAGHVVTWGDASTWRREIEAAYRLTGLGWMADPQHVVTEVES
jgi:hypothetical protein